MKRAVTPRVFRGFQDLLPEQMGARQRMIRTIQDVYESYGFLPLGTPAIEYLEVLTGTGGTEAQQSLFHVQNPDMRGEETSPSDALALRFDLTVPLARVVSQYQELPRPFRRYQVAQVWRADKPDRGRFREFTQFDIDSVGVPSDLADTEIIAAMCDTLAALGVQGYRVRFSSRAVLNLLLAFAEVPERWTVLDAKGRNVEFHGSDVFRVLDKLDKIGPERVRKELMAGYQDDSGDTITGLGLSGSQVDRIEKFLSIHSEDRQEVLARVGTLFHAVPNAADELAVLDRMSRRLATLGYGNDRVAVDLSVARGLAYYTGPVFEAILTDAPQFGSVFGGGRYDNLVLRFLGESLPATGASIGVDRLLAALIHIGQIELRRATAQVLVAVLDKNLLDDCLAMAFELRRAGIRTELYLGDKGIGRQLKYADAIQVPFVVLLGSDEHARGVVTVKRMSVGRATAAEVAERSQWLQERAGQFEIPRDELVTQLHGILAAEGW